MDYNLVCSVALFRDATVPLVSHRCILLNIMRFSYKNTVAPPSVAFSLQPLHLAKLKLKSATLHCCDRCVAGGGIFIYPLCNACNGVCNTEYNTSNKRNAETIDRRGAYGN